MADLDHVRPGVRFDPCSPDLVDGLLRCQVALIRFGYQLMVTKGSEGVHPAEGRCDPHYLGYAVDLRSRDMRVADVPTVVRELRLVLGKNWTVVQESDHIHVQCDKFRSLVPPIGQESPPVVLPSSLGAPV